jgi:hypothetical protein
MPVILSGRKRPVVTGRTGSQYLRMVNPRSRHPHLSSVAILTNVGCQYVILVFASRVCTVVTANAIADDVYMIKIGRYPGYCCMAVVAVIPAVDMRRVFADRDRAVMTGRADTDNLRVINRYSRLEK